MLSKEKTEELTKYTKSHAKFHQTAFTKFEMMMHPFVSICLGLMFNHFERTFISTVLGIKENNTLVESLVGLEVIELFKNAVFYNILFYSGLTQAIFVKWLIYQLIGIVCGMEPLSANDDFWLWDAPVNQASVPSFIVFDKSDIKPEAMV